MLTKYAILNSAQLAIDQLARILVNFFLIPILVSNLGAVGFAIWQILQKTSLQVATLDGRVPEVLKWVIASKQNDCDIESKQCAVGSALVSFLIFTPLLIIVYSALIMLLPVYMEMGQEDVLEARYVVAILGFSAFLLAIAGMYEAAIKGMNIGYKLAGVQAVILLAGGMLSALAVIYGYGLLGLSIVQVIVSLFFIVCYSYVAKKNIIWLGISRPSLAEVKQSFHRSKWYTIWAFISMWMLTGDVIILGLFVEAPVVSQYILTMYLSQMVTVAILTAIIAILPAMAGVIGNGENERAQALRQESFLYSWWLSTAICSTVIVFNQSFVSLWVGNENFAGNNINALITLCIMQLVIIRQNADMLNIALDIRKKVVLGFVSAIFTLLLMVALVPYFQLYGLCIALLLGRFPLQIVYPKIINKYLNTNDVVGFPIRKIVITISLLMIGWLLSSYVFIDSWFALLGASFTFFLLIIILAYVFGFDGVQKKVAYSRYLQIKSMV